MMECSYCNKNIEDLNNMIKGIHIHCAKEIVNAYCFVNDLKLEPKEE